MELNNKQKVGQDEWFEYFKSEGHPLIRISKFRSGKVDMSLEDLSKQWVGWSEEQKLGFASAFSVKHEITTADERILDFLMSQGDERTILVLALCLTRHSDKERIVSFLGSRLLVGLEPKANIIQALALLGNPLAVGPLQQLLEVMHSQSKRDKWWKLDYVYTHWALVQLRAQPPAAFEELMNNADSELRDTAIQLSKGPPPPSWDRPTSP